MFKIKKNTFVTDGICKYEDENGNTMFFKRWINRKKDGFTAKLRFKDIPIKVASYDAEYPIDYEANPKGFKVNLEYPSGYDITQKEVQEVLAAFSNMIVHWDSMIHAIKMLECKDDLLLKAHPELQNEENVQKAKYNNLLQYEELTPIISQIFR